MWGYKYRWRAEIVLSLSSFQWRNLEIVPEIFVRNFVLDVWFCVINSRWEHDIEDLKEMILRPAKFNQTRSLLFAEFNLHFAVGWGLLVDFAVCTRLILVHNSHFVYENFGWENHMSCKRKRLTTTRLHRHRSLIFTSKVTTSEYKNFN